MAGLFLLFLTSPLFNRVNRYLSLFEHFFVEGSLASLAGPTPTDCFLTLASEFGLWLYQSAHSASSFIQPTPAVLVLMIPNPHPSHTFPLSSCHAHRAIRWASPFALPHGFSLVYPKHTPLLPLLGTNDTCSIRWSHRKPRLSPGLNV